MSMSNDNFYENGDFKKVYMGQPPKEETKKHPKAHKKSAPKKEKVETLKLKEVKPSKEEREEAKKAAKQKAIDERNAAKQKAAEEKKAAKQKALEEQKAAKQKALEKEKADRIKAMQEEEAAKKKAAEEEKKRKQIEKKRVYMGSAPDPQSDKSKKTHKLSKKLRMGITAAAVLCVLSIAGIIVGTRLAAYGDNTDEDGNVRILEIVPDYACDELSLVVDPSGSILSFDKFVKNACPKPEFNDNHEITNESKAAIENFISSSDSNAVTLVKYVDLLRTLLTYKSPYVCIYSYENGEMKVYNAIENNGDGYLKDHELKQALPSLNYDLTRLHIGLFDSESKPIHLGTDDNGKVVDISNYFGYTVFGLNSQQVQYDSVGNVKMKISVKLAGEVTTNDIDDADLIYINGKMHGGQSAQKYYDIYNKVNPETPIEASESAYTWASGWQHDLNPNVAFYLYQEYTLGKIVLYGSNDVDASGDLNNTNVTRLLKLMTTIDPDTFIKEWAAKKVTVDSTNKVYRYDGSVGSVEFQDNYNKGYNLIELVYKDKNGATKRMQFGSSMFAYDNDHLNSDQFNKYPYYDSPKNNVFVTQNSYMYNGDNSFTRVFLKQDVEGEDYEKYKDDPSKEEYQGTAFTDLREFHGIAEKGEEPTEDKVAYRPVAPCEIIQFLFNGLNKNKFTNAHDLNVLEIEPCRDFKYDYASATSQDAKESILFNIKTFASYYSFSEYSNIKKYGKFKTPAEYESYLNNPENKRINFDCVSTAEFNGMNEDLLAKYDVIVIGSQDGLMNKAAGRTIYNDTSLDGYVYLAYGDLVKASTYLLGYDSNDFVCVDDRIANGKVSKGGVSGGVTVAPEEGFASTYNLTHLNSHATIYSKNSVNNTGQFLFTPGVFSKLSAMQGNYFVIKSVADTFSGVTDVNAYYANPLGNARFSDNDITAKKIADLEEFLAAEKPIVFDSKLLPLDNSKGVSVAYPTSHIKQFMDSSRDNVDYSDYVIDQREANAGILSKIPINEIEINACELSYENPDSPGNYISIPDMSYNQTTGLIDSQCKISNVKSIRVKAVFTGQKSHKFNITMWLDKNADGLFSKHIVDDDSNELLGSKLVDDSNKITDSSIATNTEVEGNPNMETYYYIFDVPLPEGYNGLFSWKVQVDDVTDLPDLATRLADRSEIHNDTTEVNSAASNGEPTLENPGEGSTTENPGEGNTTENPGEGSTTENPGEGGETETPGEGGETETPGEGGETETPGEGSTTETPGEGGETETPGEGGETETPEEGEGSQVENPDYFPPINEIIPHRGARQIKKGNFVMLGNVKTVNVLQIVPGDAAGNTASGCTLNMKDNAKFQKLLQDAAKEINFTITVDTITTEQYEKVFESAPYHKGEDYTTPTNYLKANNYSMLVIGFGDMYACKDITNDNGAVDCITDFIDHRNAVLFAHDSVGFTDFVNTRFKATSDGNVTGLGAASAGGEGHDVWGLDLSSKLRDKVGMDRYSVTQVENTNVPSKDSNPDNKITEIQGLNNYILYKMGYNHTFTSSRRSSGIYTLGQYPDLATHYENNRQFTTTSVENINGGLITTFPYKTADDQKKLSVATTHPQYFQLDMEDEGLVVWYTLAGGDNTYFKTTARDAANNYYIYSKDNITYSGAGHSNLSSDAELKLYVNTIIKTASASNYAPSVEVTNGYKTSDRSTYVIHPHLNDEDIEVEYIATDKDLVPHVGKLIRGGITWINDSDPNNVQEIPLEEFSVNNPVISEDKRTFKLSKDSDCYKYYQEHQKVKLRISVADACEEYASCVVEIVPRDLFDLE